MSANAGRKSLQFKDMDVSGVKFLIIVDPNTGHNIALDPTEYAELRKHVNAGHVNMTDAAEVMRRQQDPQRYARENKT